MTDPIPLFYIIAILVGLSAGSFITMLSWRLPRTLLEEETDLPLAAKRSHCPTCLHKLSWYHLIPFFSWMALKGKCTHCGHKISLRYPIIEGMTAIMTIACLWHFGFDFIGFSAVILSWFLIAITVVDLEHHLILDDFSLPLLWIGLLLNSQHIFTSAEQAIIGATAGYGLLWALFHAYKFVTGKEGMGYGDFKMLAALGAWFGIKALPIVLIIASVSSLVIGLILIVFSKMRWEQQIPFGPYLALGGWGALFYFF